MRLSYFGPPTFFLTINPAEWNWPELHEFYSTVHKKEITPANLQQLITADPGLFARFYRHRIDTIFKQLLLINDGPLGKVIHFYHRKEWQSRGATHVHALVWVKDAPVLGRSTPEEVQQFVEKHITCRRPDPVKEPELAELVANFQEHRCTRNF